LFQSLEAAGHQQHVAVPEGFVRRRRELLLALAADAQHLQTEDCANSDLRERLAGKRRVVRHAKKENPFLQMILLAQIQRPMLGSFAGHVALWQQVPPDQCHERRAREQHRSAQRREVKDAEWP